MTDSAAANGQGAPGGRPDGIAGPVLYRRPVPLDRGRHGDWRVRRPQVYAFAQTAASLPLGLEELAVAQADYPIVFTPTGEPMPVAVLGLNQQRNLFVDSDGRWAAGCYVPAYVRRYPFVFIRPPEAERFILGIDEAYEGFGGEGEPLFSDGKLAPVVEQALGFATNCQAQFDAARAFGHRLAELGLLVERRFDGKLGPDSKVAVGPFRVVDEAKLRDLAQEVVGELWRALYAKALYAHLFSLSRWQPLMRRAMQA